MGEREGGREGGRERGKEEEREGGRELLTRNHQVATLSDTSPWTRWYHHWHLHRLHLEMCEGVLLVHSSDQRDKTGMTANITSLLISSYFINVMESWNTSGRNKREEDYEWGWRERESKVGEMYLDNVCSSPLLAILSLHFCNIKKNLHQSST